MSAAQTDAHLEATETGLYMAFDMMGVYRIV